MHAIAFGLKRAFHSALALTRRPLAKLGITSARLDMLHAIDGAGWGGRLQRDLRESLGVTPATISRMLRSLEQLGYVTRERLRADARQLVVRLTEVGRAILRRAFADLQVGVELAFDCALCGDAWWNEAAQFEQMDCAETHLRRIRHSFGDLAMLRYPWHPDD